jgi:hypothetical protein
LKTRAKPACARAQATWWQITTVSVGAHALDLGRTLGTWYLQENPGQLIELPELMGYSNLSQVRKCALSDAERAPAGAGRGTVETEWVAPLH